MKRSKLNLLLIAGFLAGLMAGCTEPGPSEVIIPPTPTTGVIQGTVSLRSGIVGDLTNTRVAVYNSLLELADADVAAAVFETSLQGPSSDQYVIGPLNPGSYYLEIWKDLNGDAQRDDWPTDIRVFRNSDNLCVSNIYDAAPILVIAGSTMTVNLKINALP